MKAQPRQRLDVLMVARGLADTRDWAQRLVRAGEVRVNGQVIDLPSRLVTADVAIAVQNPPKYVSRGGFKLEAALDRFGLDPSGLVCADVGSSTGGFTDCLLQRSAARVYALDVGNNQLHWKLRQDPRVVVMEGVNVRYLEALPEAVAFAATDVSFISLTLILPRIFDWIPAADPGDVLHAERPVTWGSVVALIKPQFEAGRDKVGRGGIVRDPLVHQEVTERIIAFCAGLGWRAAGLIESPILGAEGNKEFLVWLQRGE
ncbi:MAG: TlyA family RNA methyltransferase [Chloroflexi bacterium]|nr:TlyA family RNA methyltransferase [Chloroflexota bacterium]MCL5273465.1 TlyA family RNA methyltransferase [Chloroflexota bacterium]